MYTIDIDHVIGQLTHRYNLHVETNHTGGGRMVALITAPRREPLAFGPFHVRSERYVADPTDLTYGPPETADGPTGPAADVPAGIDAPALAALPHVAAYDRPYSQ